MFSIKHNGITIIKEAIYDTNEDVFAFKAEDISMGGKGFIFKV